MRGLSFLVGSMVVLAGFAPKAALAESILRVEPLVSTPYVLAGQPCKLYLKIGLTGIANAAGHRAPVNLALVLDHSGSMQGDKLAQAKRAATVAVESLSPEDTESVVAYDHTVDVVVTARPATDKRSIIRAIESIRVGGTTALFAGVSVGASQLRRYLDHNRVNRVILLSDGLANVGPSSPGELASLGASLAKEGISVTTMGLGLGYNEDLMARLAMAADGNHVFVENSEDLARIFALELGDVLSVVAQDVRIELTLPMDIRPLRLLGRDGLIDNRVVSTHLSQVYANQEKFMLLELELDGPQVGTRRTIGDVAVVYRDLQGHEQRSLATVSVEGAASQPVVERNTDQRVQSAAVELLANEQNKLALNLRDQGKTDEARRVLEQNEAYLRQQNTTLKSKRLENLEKQNAVQSQNLDDKSWNRSRKEMRDMQYQSETQQSY